jgi:hypothetical protein
MSRAEHDAGPANRAGLGEPNLSADLTWCRAASVLGWAGVVVEDMRLLGLRITVVADVDQQVHADRQASGWEPITDCTTLALWEDWPEHPMVPPSAVRLTGFLARGRRWQQAMHRAGGFVGFGSTAILLEPNSAPTPVCMMTAHYYGVGVIRSTPTGAVELVQEGRHGPVSTARPNAISREAEELVYREILNRGLAVVPGAE